MSVDENKPWACIPHSPTGPFAQVLDKTKAHLYLLHFTASTSPRWNGDNANKQWALMRAAMEKTPPAESPLVPLCSSTVSVGSGGSNWSRCIDDAVFDQEATKYGDNNVPFELWVMTIGGPLQFSHMDTTVRFELGATTNSISQITGQKDLANPKENAAKACMPQAIALRWLLQNRKDQTLAALQQAGFSGLVFHETPYVQLLAKDGAVVLEGVAGIGKTHSISKVRGGLASVCPQGLITTLDTFIKGLENKQPSNCDLVAELKKLAPPPPCSVVKTRIFVMHPSTSYEEMIGGLRPKARRPVPSGTPTPTSPGATTPASLGTPTPESGQEFDWEPGKVTRIINAAYDDLSKNSGCCHLVVFDEINRCNLPSVLGELIYLIEPSRRITRAVLDQAKRSVAAGSSTCDNDYLCDNGYAVPLGPEDDKGILCIPENLFFLGTMNSSDRSILGFDQALRRRFPPYRLEPMTVQQLAESLFGVGADTFRRHRDAVQKGSSGTDTLTVYLTALQKSGNKQSDCDELNAILKKLSFDLNKTVAELTSLLGKLDAAITAWGCLNVLLRCVIGPDAMIGHSYWFNALERHNGEPNNAWRFGVLPQAIHAAESARMERFLADIFDDNKKPSDIASEYVNPEQENNGEARLEEATLACCPEATPPFTTVKGMVDALREMRTIVKLVGRGHGEKLVVVQKAAPRTAATSSTNTSVSSAARSQSTKDGNSSSDGDAFSTTAGGGDTTSTPTDSTSHGTTD